MGPADSGYAALDAAQLEDFDAVILDVDMPGMDGIEVGRRLRSDPRTACFAIAMHTTMLEEDVRCIFTDYEVFLTKPCETQSLAVSIDRLVQKTVDNCLAAGVPRKPPPTKGISR